MKGSLLLACGTTEPGTMGYSVGPRLATALRRQFPGDVLVKGIEYPGMCFPGSGKYQTLRSLLMYIFSLVNVLYHHPGHTTIPATSFSHQNQAKSHPNIFTTVE
jgi:hypothetical protein